MADILETILDRNLLAPLATVELLYEKCPNYDPDEDPTAEVILSLADIKENDLTVEGHSKSLHTYYKEFLQTILGDSFEDHTLLDNLVTLRYKDEVLTFVSRPRICMVDGYPTLIIGAEDKKTDTHAQKFPLAITPEGITIPGSKIKRLTISSLEIQKADQTKVKLPIACFNTNKTVYAIHVSTLPDTSFYDLQTAWEDKDAEKLGELIATPYGASANLNSIFTHVMEAGAFPKDGVVIPLTSLTKEKVEGKGKGGGNFWKVTYNVDTSFFPPISVSAYYDGEQSDSVPLNMVRSISCYQGETLGTIAFTDKADKNPPTSSNPWYLHIKGKDPKKKSPIHVVFQENLGAKQARILESQKSAAFFPMPTRSPAIAAKSAKA